MNALEVDDHKQYNTNLHGQGSAKGSKHHMTSRLREMQIECLQITLGDLPLKLQIICMTELMGRTLPLLE